jgi:hypothetical protein
MAPATPYHCPRCPQSAGYSVQLPTLCPQTSWVGLTIKNPHRAWRASKKLRSP